LGAALPLIVWLGLGIFGLTRQIASEVARNPASVRLVLQIASEITTVCFLGLQIVFFIVRHLPTAKTMGILPRLVAAAAANAGLLFLLLPRVSFLPIGIAATSYLLVTAGMILSISVLMWLGRSFSVFPQARRLVVSGAYSVVRHPLYVSEFLASLGAMWQFSQPWAALIAIGTMAIQFPRMDYEEDVLARAFPEYAAYAGRVQWRLIPRVY
ncbi:MAG TPA: isoprenylcysteine carboxylmethyltransferase family protein, partial [Rhizomicrobium sp.]|nr:isoprenylcysteine carboxylmethyltransferase family protein [Rhizomicrobium sp.]